MPTLFKRSNGIYYVVLTDGSGRRRWVSTRQRQKSLALKALAEGTPRSPQKPKGKSVEEFFREFLEYGQNVYSPENLQVYKRAFRGFLRHIGNVRLFALSPKQVDNLKTKRLGEVGRVTVNIELRSLRAAFYTAVRWKLMGENPFKQVQQCPIEEATPVYLTHQEFESLLGVVKLTWLRDVIIVAAYSGMRRGEIVQLRWEDIDSGSDTIMIRSHGKVRTKFGKLRILPIHPEAKQILMRRRQEKCGEFVFHIKGAGIDARHLSRMFKRYVRRAGLQESLHFHSLRHSFASWLVQSNASLYQVQKLLGHSSIRVTEMYSHLVSADLRATINKISS